MSLTSTGKALAKGVLLGVGRVKRALTPETIRYQGMVLPARHLRLGGAHFRSNRAFLQSGQHEARRLVQRLDLGPQSRILDIGCGMGRLPIGLLSSGVRLRHYHGVDVSRRSIAWCQRHIAARHPGFQFTHLDLQNERYNPGGREIDPQARLPIGDGSVEIIYLYSVFSHMRSAGVSAYLEEFRRLLVPGGRVFLTAFVEPDVPDEEVNPPGYGQMKWSGPLHCVRFERQFFEGLVRARGFRVDRLDHGVETDGQSGIYLTFTPGDGG